MQIKYFQDTDTLLVNFIESEIVETQGLRARPDFIFWRSVLCAFIEAISRALEV